MTSTAPLLRRLLQQRLNPTHLEVVDESAQHVGHREAKNGSHIQVTIVIEQFNGLSLLQRHRLVYSAVGDFSLIALHALSLTTLTPEEYSLHHS